MAYHHTLAQCTISAMRRHHHWENDCANVDTLKHSIDSKCCCSVLNLEPLDNHSRSKKCPVMMQNDFWNDCIRTENHGHAQKYAHYWPLLLLILPCKYWNWVRSPRSSGPRFVRVSWVRPVLKFIQVWPRLDHVRYWIKKYMIWRCNDADIHSL